MKINIKQKMTRTRIFALISAVAVVALLLLNMLLTHVGLQHSLYLDTTSEGIYTLSEKMKTECAFIDKLDDGEKTVKITFCADPDTLVKSETTRVTYFMALRMQDYFDNLEVEIVNVEYNPTAVAQYKPTSLAEIAPDDIIISYGDDRTADRYRVINAKNFWVTSEGNLYSYNGEYKMASIIMSVVSVNRPVAYFVTDLGDSYYDPSPEAADRAENLELAYLYDLLTERGLEVKTLQLSSVERVPADCALLIINNPERDFEVDASRLDEYNYVTDTEKLDRYLVAGYGSIMVTRDFAGTTPMPNLDTFLYEWGISFSTAQVKDEENYMGAEITTVVGEYNTSEESYGYGIYGDFAKLTSAPPMVFSNTGYLSCSFDGATSAPEAGTYAASINYAPLISTYKTARAYEKNADTDTYVDLLTEGALDLAAISTRIELDSYSGEEKFSYIFCTGSKDFFSSDLLGNASYANYEVVSSLVENMARIDEFASIELGGTSYNSPNLGGKPLADLTIYETDTALESGRILHGLSAGEMVGIATFIMLVPAAVAILGVVICVRRKFL